MAKNQENVCKKFGITREELQEGVDQLGKYFGKFAGDINVLLAMITLLTSGDIDEKGGAAE